MKDIQSRTRNPGNILDRVDWLEQRIASLERELELRQRAYGGLYWENAGYVESLTSGTWTPITSATAQDPNILNMTATPATGLLSCQIAGVYLVAFNFNFMVSSNNITLEVAGYVDGQVGAPLADISAPRNEMMNFAFPMVTFPWGYNESLGLAMRPNNNTTLTIENGDFTAVLLD